MSTHDSPAKAKIKEVEAPKKSEGKRIIFTKTKAKSGGTDKFAKHSEFLEKLKSKRGEGGGLFQI